MLRKAILTPPSKRVIRESCGRARSASARRRGARALTLTLLSALLWSGWAFAQTSGPGTAATAARVENFTPQGEVKGIRQAQVRFSEQMVPFGDPTRTANPFDISCPAKGKGHWVDGANWVYDFDQDLPAGIRGVFSLKPGLKTLAGKELGGPRSFSFTTGGPAIIESRPYQGSNNIDEEQIFILDLDGPAKEDSILKNAWFVVEGIQEKVEARIVEGDERKQIMDSVERWRRRDPKLTVLLAARRRFPNLVRVDLVWGKGILTESGVPTSKDQLLPFRVRASFRATFSCARENADAACMPLGALRVYFTSAVSWSVAKQINLTGPGGKKWSPKQENEDEDEEEQDQRFVRGVRFEGPFPENADLIIELPPDMRDDSNRRLSNVSEYPLKVRTADYPPLAKFSADFGILELNGDRLLPVTLRGLEAEVKGLAVKAASDGAAAASATMPGNTLRVPSDQAGQILFWLDRINARDWGDREKSIFQGTSNVTPSPFQLPKPGGAKAFEVVGIPLAGPGFYVVELQSEVLGAALLGKPAPVYVPTTALVTNLAVHFKRGKESSLVWVTSLDQAKPVSGAAVEICDCAGVTMFRGTTDQKGIARVGSLPIPAKDCGGQSGWGPYRRGYLAIARLGQDMAFTHTSWDEGIEPWRFNLATECDQCETRQAQTILGRSLLRAGETLHMKHVLRKRTLEGFALLPESDRPTRVLLRHAGSAQEYEFPLTWDAAGIAETEWKIPQDAKLGFYNVILTKARTNPDEYREGIISAEFRVEEYRVPLLKASVQFPAAPLVAPAEVAVDLGVQYLAGGGASRLPVRLRYRTTPTGWLSFGDFEGFAFDNGKVKEGLVRGGEEERPEEKPPVKRMDLTLDETGAARATIPDLKAAPVPSILDVELDFRDPNGESNTVSASARLWSAGLVVGLKTQAWVLVKKEMEFQAAAADLRGKPLAGQRITVDLLRTNRYSHRKRLVGGFYAYENYAEVKRVQTICEGVTDAKGILPCSFQPAQGGEFTLEARAADDQGRRTYAQTGFWVGLQERWWFPMGDDDRMDVIPEQKRYEPGDTARFQVRLPFEKATVLVTVEREGVGDAFVQELSGTEPVVQIPVKGAYGPNVFVSVLAVRGRVASPAPTAMVDLARPAFKLGVAEIQVGWKHYELKVKVAADREVYRVREKATVKISVTSAAGRKLPPGSEVAVAAVDEGLLELMPNTTWNLLESMMGHRAYAVATSTAQMHVVGKRHFGQKGMPSGGGGGRQTTRELFDTLLLWKGRVALDPSGAAVVEVPLNDSITSFRIVAVATAGVDMFGSGATSIRSIQELTLYSGLAPVVRFGDRVSSVFTVRNATQQPLEVAVTGRIRELPKPFEPKAVSLAGGESKEISWTIVAPPGLTTLHYDVEAKGGGYSDHLVATQRVVEAVPVRVVQATVSQLEGVSHEFIEKPKDALVGWGGVNVVLRPTLLAGLEGVRRYMNRYPYDCLEQKVSKAIALQDKAMWDRITADLPSYLDSDGLAKYFPEMRFGSDTLTAYVLAIANEAGWDVGPSGDRMKQGLRGFINGSVQRWSSLPTADLMLRKVAAIEALSRYGEAEPEMLTSLDIQPNLWPTSGVIDWFSLLSRMKNAPGRARRLAEAEQILRSRLNFQGTVMSFSTDTSDCLWWLMLSNDVNAVRLVGAMIDFGKWTQDMPRLVRGALSRQHFGHWDLTTANAWGVLAMNKFSATFEKTPVSGRTNSYLAGKTLTLDWAAKPKGDASVLPWPSGRQELTVQHVGAGKPWLTLQSLAAIPLKAPFSSGYRITRTVSGVEQKRPGQFTKGDILRVKLEIEAQADMTWVVVSDPIPAGATILGTGLGRDSALSTSTEESEGWYWPAFQERSFEAFRAYYEYVPKGTFSVEYTVRLNSSGEMNLPPTRVEALYSPEMFGEIPNAAVSIK